MLLCGCRPCGILMQLAACQLPVPAWCNLCWGLSEAVAAVVICTASTKCSSSDRLSLASDDGPFARHPLKHGESGWRSKKEDGSGDDDDDDDQSRSNLPHGIALPTVPSSHAWWRRLECAWFEVRGQSLSLFQLNGTAGAQDPGTGIDCDGLIHRAHTRARRESLEIWLCEFLGLLFCRV